jgi:hypothetical protein
MGHANAPSVSSVPSVPSFSRETFPIALWPSASTLKSQPNQEFIMGKGNNSRKKEVKKPKKEKPKVLATRKTN